MPLLPQRRRRESRWEEDNRVELNPAAFVTVGLVIAAIVGLALLLWLV